MKKLILSFVAIATIAINSFGQAPEGFKYQAVVRDAGNTILNNQAVGMRMTIQQGSIGGVTVYSETFVATTNAYGLVNLEIGTGSTSYDFTTIDWANGPYFMETAVDITGGTSYTVMGTSQLMSVPYALYAKTSGNGQGPVGPQGPAGNDGAVGATGPQGPAGNDGVDGTAGATGPQGIQGPAGNDGVDGIDGATGPQGATGLTGAQGPQGSVGNDGAVGATGPQGPIGLTGAQGIQGLPGTNGAVGATGPQGPAGNDGVDGTAGATGPQGIQGPAGNDGAVGAVGATGPQGATGLTGAQGIQGLPGTNGAVGATGPQGPAGNDGVDGTAGATGPQGIQGVPGNDGADGAAGAQGIQGVPGNDGVGIAQTLSQIGNTITLSDGGGSVNIDDADSDPSNELQVLSFSDDTLYLSNGGNVYLGAYGSGNVFTATAGVKLGYASSSTWVCPTGITEIQLELFGGAGGGGSAGSPNGSGGNGGYGGYIKQVVTVVPGQVYDITIGAGGVGTWIVNGSNYEVANGGDGGISTFGQGASVLLMAEGGDGGILGMGGPLNWDIHYAPSGAILNWTYPANVPGGTVPYVPVGFVQNPPTSSAKGGAGGGYCTNGMGTNPCYSFIISGGKPGDGGFCIITY